jgi:hypothetical protein
MTCSEREIPTLAASPADDFVGKGPSISQRKETAALGKEIVQQK